MTDIFIIVAKKRDDDCYIFKQNDAGKRIFPHT